MEVNTPIAEDVIAAEYKSDLDAACKRLLAYKLILAHILKHTLPEEYKDCTVEEIAEKYIEATPLGGTVPEAQGRTGAPQIQGIGNEYATLTEGSNINDLIFTALAPRNGMLIQLIVDLEAQNDFGPGYPIPKRGIFNCGRMISAQKGTVFIHSDYQKLQKVAGIWVCPYPAKKYRNTITRFHMVEENLVGKVTTPLDHYDLIDLILVCLSGGDTGVITTAAC